MQEQTNQNNQSSLGKKVLIVEDEHDLRELYMDILKEAGYEVDGAADGGEGLEKIKNNEWNLLLLDIMLPGKDGLKILKDISETPGLKKGHIVVLTNLNGENIIQEAFNLGADGYLIKSDNTPDKVLEEVGKYFI